MRFFVTAVLAFGCAALAYAEEPAATFESALSKKFQPNFGHPRKYAPAEMETLAREVLTQIEKKLGTPFNRKDPQHVWTLAEFFGLTPREDLDLYSTPMEEPDVRYFSEIEEHGRKELYPQTPEDLVIRFYWEGLARAGAAYYKLEVVNEKRSAHPQKSRGKVSDMATTAMFDKRPGITLAQVRAEGRERYDVDRLIKHLKLKGLPTA